MKKQTVLIILVAVLLVLSGFQAIQLLGMQNTVSSETVESSSKKLSSSGDVQVPNNIESLPGMVGGC